MKQRLADNFTPTSGLETDDTILNCIKASFEPVLQMTTTESCFDWKACLTEVLRHHKM